MDYYEIEFNKGILKWIAKHFLKEIPEKNSATSSVTKNNDINITKTIQNDGTNISFVINTGHTSQKFSQSQIDRKRKKIIIKIDRKFVNKFSSPEEEK